MLQESIFITIIGLCYLGINYWLCLKALGIINRRSEDIRIKLEKIYHS